MRESPGFLGGFARWIDALPPGVVFALALGTTAVVGILDEVTGPDLELAVVYLIPIWFAAWFLGAAGGIVIALAAAIAGWAANLATRAYLPPFAAVQVLNVASQTVLFATVAVLLASVRRGGRRESFLARTDSLTGLLNRRGFLEVARREMARSARSGRPLTVALADVDRFEEVNDLRGQDAGDHLLGGMGTALRSAMRAVDASARLGGDEFAMLLPDADIESIEAVLDRLRLVLMQAAAEKGAPVTVSLGAATFQRPPSSLDEMLRAAGRMLHDAKTSGRSAVRHDRIGPVVLVILSMAAVRVDAGESARPFVFTAIAPAEERGWVAHYDAGYSERSDATVAENGFEQRIGVQGRLGHGLTLLGRVGLVVDGERETGSTGEAELLRDVTAWHGVRLAAGGGFRRELEGTTVLLARAAVGKTFARSALWSNLRLERPLAPGRDAIDLVTSIGWTRRLGRSLHAGIEALGEDLEGFWEPEEAEGGARLFVGPSIRLAPERRPWQLSLAGGPVMRATQSPRTSPAGRALAPRNGYAVRASLSYAF